MLEILPARSSKSITIPTESLARVIHAVGSPGYDTACCTLLAQLLGVDRWTLFRRSHDTSISCMAWASHTKVEAVRASVDKFLGRCHSVDPSMAMLSRQPHRNPCMIKISISDIKDRQYRECFESTEVEQRLSYFTRTPLGLYQLSVFYGPGRNAFTRAEMDLFATIADLIMATALQHEERSKAAADPTGPLTVPLLQERLAKHAAGLSERECEVCARAIAGMTIEGTALDLDIAKTSVITYRQRAYQKLGISSLNELVALLHNVKPDPAVPCGARHAAGASLRLRSLNS